MPRMDYRGIALVAASVAAFAVCWCFPHEVSSLLGALPLQVQIALFLVVVSLGIAAEWKD